MAYPYIFEDNFELGTNAGWDSETDTGSQLDFPHYSELARFPWSNSTPYNGAYCMRAVLAGGTADAFVTEGDLNIANTATGHIRFALWFSSNLDATADDTFALFEFQGAASAVTVSIGARYVAATDVINIGAGSAASGAAPTSFAALAMKRNTWYVIEASVTVQTGGSGTVDVFITEEGQRPQATADIALTSITHIAVTDGIFGLQNHLASTTGTILFDDFVMNEARVYPNPRFHSAPIITKSQHVFVGRGAIESVALLTTGGSEILELWDTDEADTNQIEGNLVNLEDGITSAYSGPLEFQKGCYANLSGTDPRAQVILVEHRNTLRLPGPNVRGSAQMMQYGLKRRA